MSDSKPTAAYSSYMAYGDAPELVGRQWKSHDGIVTVTDKRSPGGMYMVRRADGREHFIRPSIIMEALAKDGV